MREPKPLADSAFTRRWSHKDRWEKTVCEFIDRILEAPERRGKAIDELLDYIEDLGINAYFRGKLNAKKS